MSNLIITMIAIGLAVVVSAMGFNYINTDIIRSKEYQHSAEAGFLKLKIAYDLYLLYNKEKMSTADDLATQVNSVKGASLTGGMMPPPIKGGFNWSYNSSGIRYYFCLSGDYTPVAMRGFKSLNDFEITKSVAVNYLIYINDYCGATSDDLTIDTGNLAVTYWITR